MSVVTRLSDNVQIKKDGFIVCSAVKQLSIAFLVSLTKPPKSSLMRYPSVILRHTRTQSRRGDVQAALRSSAREGLIHQKQV